MELFITRLTPYNERDYIVNGLTKTGFLTFRAVGALKPTSSSASSLLLYGFVDIELRESKTGATLTYIKPLVQTVKLFLQPEKITALALVGEIVSKVIQDENEVSDVFRLLKATLYELEVTTHVHSLLYLFVAQLLKILGYGFKINGCINCGATSNIVGLNFHEGGFVCKNCVNGDTKLLARHEIDVFRYAFMIDDTQLAHHQFNSDEVDYFLRRLITYLEESYNFVFQSKNLYFS